MNKIVKNKIAQWAAGVLGLIGALTAVAMGVYMTWLVMGRVLPGNEAARYMALAFFDGGAFVWAGMYIFKAKGTPQRGISLILLIIDLVGVVLLVIAEIYLGGQSLVNIPAWTGRLVVNTVVVVFTLNLIGWYYYHINSPETREAITAQELEDELTEQAEQQARANIEREARALGALLAGRVTSRIKYRMRLPMSESEEAQWRGDVIDAEELPQPALPGPTQPGIWEWLKSFLLIGLPQARQSEPITATPNLEPNSDEARPPAPPPEPKE